MYSFKKIALAALGMLQLFPLAAPAAKPGTLKAGAARGDNARHERHSAAFHLDSRFLFARAIYLGNGRNRAVLLNADVGGMSNTITDKAAAAISHEFNIPVANILISATHNLSSDRRDSNSPSSKLHPCKAACSSGGVVEDRM